MEDVVGEIGAYAADSVRRRVKMKDVWSRHAIATC